MFNLKRGSSLFAQTGGLCEQTFDPAALP